jgi:hypothetical protein
VPITLLMDSEFCFVMRAFLRPERAKHHIFAGRMLGRVLTNGQPRCALAQSGRTWKQRLDGLGRA